MWLGFFAVVTFKGCQWDAVSLESELLKLLTKDLHGEALETQPEAYLEEVASVTP